MRRECFEDFDQSESLKMIHNILSYKDICRWDYHWCPELGDSVPLYKTAHTVSQDMCEEYLDCRMPTGDTGDLWIVTDPPEIPGAGTVLTLLDKTKLDENLTRYSFQYSGPSMVSVSATAREGAEIIFPTPGHFTANFLSGKMAGSGNFELTVKSGRSEDTSLLDIAITGHYYSGEVRTRKSLKVIIMNAMQGMVTTLQFQHFINQHPHWVTLRAYTVDYKYYIF